MEFKSSYVSHVPDAHGEIKYSAQENLTWKTLYERQISIVKDYACQEFLEGIDALKLSAEAIPQLPQVSQRLKALTGWTVSPVKALISAREFFTLLSERQFPAATFIRYPEELDYVKEPDIFHELFGHCPMLTQPVYADFVHAYATQVLQFPEEQWPLLQRLFWFTVEFGLIQTKKGIKAYGGGILSSVRETPYSIDSKEALRVFFDPVAAFRMPYRIDRPQPVYFVIENYEQLYQLIQSDLSKAISLAKTLGEFPPYFPVDENNPNIHIHAC